MGSADKATMLATSHRIRALISTMLPAFVLILVPVVPHLGPQSFTAPPQRVSWSPNHFSSVPLLPSLPDLEDDRISYIREIRATRSLLARAPLPLPSAKSVVAAVPLSVRMAATCPTIAPVNTLRDGSLALGVTALCRYAVLHAASPEAAAAIIWAFQQLGTPYACDGVGRSAPERFYCSSLVARAYHEGAHLETATNEWAPSTRDMTPWDGRLLDPHYVSIRPDALKPGDLALYGPCDGGVCRTEHVVMYLGILEGRPWMLHTNHCGDVAHIKLFRGTSAAAGFAAARRVIRVATDPAFSWTPSMA
jgi:cell wall-associated NlpC family hydrolase